MVWSTGLEYVSRFDVGVTISLPHKIIPKSRLTVSLAVRTWSRWRSRGNADFCPIKGLGEPHHVKHLVNENIVGFIDYCVPKFLLSLPLYWALHIRASGYQCLSSHIPYTQYRIVSISFLCYRNPLDQFFHWARCHRLINFTRYFCKRITELAEPIQCVTINDYYKVHVRRWRVSKAISRSRRITRCWEGESTAPSITMRCALSLW